MQDDVVDTTALTSMSGMASSDAVVADRYRLGAPLGQGAMANVYRAVDLRLNRDVAIKLFHPGQDATVRIRFGAEAQALARLSHPGLVGIYDAGVDDDDRPYLVMDLVDGESLRDRLLAGPLAAPEAMALGARLAAALAHVHANDVVHRDVKPSNIVLDAQALPHLADFGIALLLDAARMTGSNEILGTAAYLAPEQILGDPVGASADVYSLGLVLLECLTGELEYPGVSKVESALARLHRPPRVPADVPPALATLLTAMTARCPADRPTAAECAVRLSGGRSLSRRRKGSRPAVLVGWRRFAVAGSSLAIAIIASAWMLTSLMPRFSPSTAIPGVPTRHYGTTDRVPAAAASPGRVRVAVPMAAEGPEFDGGAPTTTSTGPPINAVMAVTPNGPVTTPATTNPPVAFGPSQSGSPTTTPTKTKHHPPRTPVRHKPTATPGLG
ncbi:MAG TPA: protein kinase [Pseudonocardiaceae bacterium]